VYLDVTLGLCSIWTCFLLFLLLSLDKKWEKVCCLGSIGDFACVFVPFLGTFVFLPILSVLVDVFACTHAVGPGALAYPVSVLDRDCYVRCWDNTPIFYVTLVCIGLVLYAAGAIRPMWEKGQSQLHIRTSQELCVGKIGFHLLLLSQRRQ